MLQLPRDQGTVPAWRCPGATHLGGAYLDDEASLLLNCWRSQKARDACIIEKGEANCTDLIEAHKACMRNLGFEV